jgi:hypothetical protein
MIKYDIFYGYLYLKKRRKTLAVCAPVCEVRTIRIGLRKTIFYAYVLRIALIFPLSVCAPVCGNERHFNPHVFKGLNIIILHVYLDILKV